MDDCDVAYKCRFCDVTFLEFESILKHNRYYCHKRKSLPRSSTVTTAMLSYPQSPGGSNASQDSSLSSPGSSSASHPLESAEGISHSKPKYVTTSENSPELDSKDKTTSPHKRTHSRVPEAAEGCWSKTNVVVRFNQEHMQPEFLEGAADFKHPASAVNASQPLHALSRTAPDLRHPTSAAITLQRLHAFSRGAGAVTDFKYPTSGKTAIQNEHMHFKIPETAADGRLTWGTSPLKREHVDSNALNAGEDSELQNSGGKRRKLSDEDESP